MSSSPNCCCCCCSVLRIQASVNWSVNTAASFHSSTYSTTRMWTRKCCWPPLAPSGSCHWVQRTSPRSRSSASFQFLFAFSVNSQRKYVHRRREATTGPDVYCLNVLLSAVHYQSDCWPCYKIVRCRFSFVVSCTCNCSFKIHSRTASNVLTTLALVFLSSWFLVTSLALYFSQQQCIIKWT